MGDIVIKGMVGTDDLGGLIPTPLCSSLAYVKLLDGTL